MNPLIVQQVFVVVCLLLEGEGLRHRAVGSQSPSTTTAGALSQNIQATPPRQESSPAHSQPGTSSSPHLFTLTWLQWSWVSRDGELHALWRVSWGCTWRRLLSVMMNVIVYGVSPGVAQGDVCSLWWWTWLFTACLVGLHRMTFVVCDDERDCLRCVSWGCAGRRL